jgi:hypothetical protein
VLHLNEQLVEALVEDIADIAEEKRNGGGKGRAGRGKDGVREGVREGVRRVGSRGL